MTACQQDWQAPNLRKVQRRQVPAFLASDPGFFHQTSELNRHPEIKRNFTWHMKRFML
jgi:hypothetical protein